VAVVVGAAAVAAATSLAECHAAASLAAEWARAARVGAVPAGTVLARGTGAIGTAIIGAAPVGTAAGEIRTVDGVGGTATGGVFPGTTSCSLAVLAFLGGGAGAGVPGAGDGGDILLDSTATAPNTVTTARMAMEIPATVMGTATDLATAMQANTAPPVDRG